MDHSLTEDLAVRRAELSGRIVGREWELDVVLAAIAAGRDLLLEGPPGTSKSTILRAITDSWGIPLLFVEGNAELTPARLVGHHNPARVLREDYSPENFVPGPLVAAMQRGGFLYIEELNRAPEDTLNALLTAMAEREIEVPRVGKIHALPQFRVVASMNPFDNVGTTRISVSFYDRLCRLAIDYQSAVEDEQIVALRTGSDDAALGARRRGVDAGHARPPGGAQRQQRPWRHRHRRSRPHAERAAGHGRQSRTPTRAPRRRAGRALSPDPPP